MIEGDSGEYEFLTEAVEMSKHLPGLLCEVGLRLGLGTKTIIDACVIHRPGSTVISIDPFGSIPYVGREHVGEIRLDYTNDMYKQVMADMSAYVLDKNVNWIPRKVTDKRYFIEQVDGVELYDLNTTIEMNYAMVHLDGPHNYEHVSKEILWFNDRMESGAIIAIDDISEDFIDIKPIQGLFAVLNWEQVKMGNKKGLWRKK